MFISKCLPFFWLNIFIKKKTLIKGQSSLNTSMIFYSLKFDRVVFLATFWKQRSKNVSNCTLFRERFFIQYFYFAVAVSFSLPDDVYAKTAKRFFCKMFAAICWGCWFLLKSNKRLRNREKVRLTRLSRAKKALQTDLEKKAAA